MQASFASAQSATTRSDFGFSHRIADLRGNPVSRGASRSRWRQGAPGRNSSAEAFEDIDQQFALLDPEHRAQPRLVRGSERLGPSQDLLAPAGQTQRMGPPVGAGIEALGQAAFFELVQQAYQSRPLDRQRGGKVGLR